jgi:hypothetical protein
MVETNYSSSNFLIFTDISIYLVPNMHDYEHDMATN